MGRSGLRDMGAALNLELPQDPPSAATPLDLFVRDE